MSPARRLQIQIRILRKISTDEETDDVITISPCCTHRRINVTYMCGDTHKSSVFNDHAEKVLSYLGLVMENLVADAEPFNSVQLISPSFPTVLYDVAKLKDCGHLLLKTVMQEMEGW